MKEAVLSKQLRDDIKEYFDDDVHINLLHDMKRTGKKFYDFYFLKNEIFVAIELKVEAGISFTINKVKPHQPGFLDEVMCQGGFAFFMICFFNKKRIFIVPPGMWDFLVIKSFGRKSIEYGMFKHNCRSIKRKKIDGKTKWDIKKLWKMVKKWP